MSFFVKAVPLGMVAAFGLAACQAPSPCSKPTPHGRVDAADQIISCLNTLNQTTPAQMPAVGTATYAGFITGTFDPAPGSTDDILGDATLTADFGAGTVAGNMTNFTSSNGVAMSGSLALTNGVIGTNTFTSTVGGTLGYGTDTVTIASTTAGGIFLGSSAQGLLAGVSGTATMGSGHVGAIDAVIAAKQ